jgi:hypothetical protein
MKAAPSEEVPKDRASLLKQSPCYSSYASAVGAREPEKPHPVGRRRPHSAPHVRTRNLVLAGTSPPDRGSYGPGHRNKSSQTNAWLRDVSRPNKSTDRQRTTIMNNDRRSKYDLQHQRAVDRLEYRRATGPSGQYRAGWCARAGWCYGRAGARPGWSDWSCRAGGGYGCHGRCRASWTIRCGRSDGACRADWTGWTCGSTGDVRNSRTYCRGQLYMRNFTDNWGLITEPQGPPIISSQAALAQPALEPGSALRGNNSALSRYSQASMRSV